MRREAASPQAWLSTGFNTARLESLNRWCQSLQPRRTSQHQGGWSEPARLRREHCHLRGMLRNELWGPLQRLPIASEINSTHRRGTCRPSMACFLHLLSVISYHAASYSGSTLLGTPSPPWSSSPGASAVPCRPSGRSFLLLSLPPTNLLQLSCLTPCL